MALGLPMRGASGVGRFYDALCFLSVATIGIFTFKLLLMFSSRSITRALASTFRSRRSAVENTSNGTLLTERMLYMDSAGVDPSERLAEALFVWHGAKVDENMIGERDSLQAKVRTKDRGRSSSPSTSPLLSSIVRSAALCSLEDAARAVFLVARRRGVTGGVVDVETKGMHGVSHLAVSGGAKWVIAVDPHPLAFENLTQLHATTNLTRFTAVRATISHEIITTTSHRTSIRPHCARIQKTGNDSLMSKQGCNFDKAALDTWTIDGLVLGNDLSRAHTVGDSDISATINASTRIILLRSDAAGHDRSVLLGSKQLISSSSADNLIIRYDPKLLRSKRIATRTLNTLLKTAYKLHMQCVHLQFVYHFNAITRLTDEPLVFPKSISTRTKRKFIQFLFRNPGYSTHLFCTRKI